MTKSDFLHKLELGLASLETQERSEILLEYAQHIDQKVQEGIKESDVIKDFGDIDELISELISDPNYKQRRENTEHIKHSFSSFGNYLQKTIDGILAMSKADIFFLLGRFCILIIIYFFAKLAFEIVGGILFGGLLTHIFLGTPIDYTISSIFSLFYDLLALLLFFYLLHYGIKKYVFPFSPQKAYEEQSYEAVKIDNATILAPKKDPKAKARPRLAKDNDPVISFLILALKVFVVLTYFIPALITLIFSVIATLLALSGALFGYPIIGVGLLGLGASLVQLAILLFVFKFLTSAQDKISSSENESVKQEVHYEK